MARKTLKRVAQNPNKLRKIRYLRVFGEKIYQHDLWYLNRRSCAVAFFTGLFCTFFPIPLQMIAAALMAILLRCNLPLSVALCWLNNPFTMTPIYYLAYRVGTFSLGRTPQPVEFQLDWNWFSQSLGASWQPLLLGCLICGLLSGGLGYLAINVLWRRAALRRWDARNKHRRQ